VLFLSGACQKSEDDKRLPPASPDASVGLAPLVAPAAALLPVPGFANAVLVSPVGATRPMPLVVAVLGIGDTPERQCAVWRERAGPLRRILARCVPGRVAGGKDTFQVPARDPDRRRSVGVDRYERRGVREGRRQARALRLRPALVRRRVRSRHPTPRSRARD